MENAIKTKKQCYFCQNNLKEVDYKEIQFLRRFINSYGKIFPTKRTGTCSKHQRRLAQAIKRARVMAMLPYTNK